MLLVAHSQDLNPVSKLIPMNKNQYRGETLGYYDTGKSLK